MWCNKNKQMKEQFLEEHTTLCKNNTSIYGQKFCNHNPERFLFFVGNKFVLVTYHRCMEFGDRYDFKKFIIESVIKNSKIFELYKVERSVNVNQELKDFRIKNKSLRKHIQQVNFMYADNSGKSYAITTKTPFIDWICNQQEIDNNFKDAKDYLIEKEYKWLIPELDDLYKYNYVYNCDDVEMSKTIDALVKSIHQLIN